MFVEPLEAHCLVVLATTFQVDAVRADFREAGRADEFIGEVMVPANRFIVFLCGFHAIDSLAQSMLHGFK